MAIPPSTLLIVEDNPADVELARESFASQDFEPTINVAYDGVEAIEYLERSAVLERPLQPDLVLLDLNLPRKSGLEVLSFIKGSSSLRRIPVVVLTSSMAKRDVVASYDLGANCYIAKPVDFTGFEEVARLTREFWFKVAMLPSR